jgi:hypothetical protein
MKKIYSTLLFLLAIATAQAQLTFVHNSPDTTLPKVVVKVDGNIVANNLAFRSAATYAFTETASVDITVEDTLGNVVLSVTGVNIEAGKQYHCYVNGVTQPSLYAANPSGANVVLNAGIIDVSAAVDSGSTRVVFVHGGTDLPTVDITKFPGALIVDNLQFGAFSETILPSVSNNINLIKSDSSLLLATFTLDLNDQSAKTVVVLLSGFLAPVQNNNGASFNVFGFKNDIIGALPNVTLIPNKISALREVKLFPNPAKTTSILSANVEDAGNYVLNIQDLSGRQMAPAQQLSLQKGLQQITISTENYTSGTYLLSLSKGNQVTTLPLMIAK